MASQKKSSPKFGQRVIINEKRGKKLEKSYSQESGLLREMEFYELFGAKLQQEK